MNGRACAARASQVSRKPLAVTSRWVRGDTMGSRNWYLPKGLHWLPKFEHEPTVAPARA